MTNIDEIISYFNNLEEVKRYKELNSYIMNNKDIKKKINELKMIQKQIVNAKEFNQPKQLDVYILDYEKKKKELSEIPFYDEYIELKIDIDNRIKNIIEEIEYRLDKEING